MKKEKTKKNGKLFLLLSVIIVVVIVLFVYFIYLFTKYDKTEYEVSVGSVLYDENLEYIKTQGEAYITQKFDRNYYLYETIDGDTRKYKLGKNAVLYKESDMYLYLYGTAYQVMSNGDVDTLGGETKVVKTSPTKFFKLDDRKYLMVDAQIKSVDDDILETKDYVIISLDKKGNPSFANHLVDFKTIKEMVVTSNSFDFDIANEKLIYQDNEIDLKNIIGSSNEYEPPVEIKTDYTDEKLEALQNNIKDNADTIVGYYDQYFNDVVNSVNNLTASVIGVNDNAIASVTKEDVYYDFDKWLVLKSITSGVTTLDVEYSIFDPTNEYQNVYLIVDGPDITLEDGSINTNTSNHYLTKNDSKYTIRNLKPDTTYVIQLAYELTGVVDPIKEDSIIATTKKAEYKIQTTKISMKEEVTGVDASGKQITEVFTYVNYELTIDPSYRFTNAELYLESNDGNGTTATSTEKKPITSDEIPESGVYTGVIKLDSTHALKKKNTLILDRLRFCIGNADEQKCDEDKNIEVEHVFFN